MESVFWCYHFCWVHNYNMSRRGCHSGYSVWLHCIRPMLAKLQFCDHLVRRCIELVNIQCWETATLLLAKSIKSQKQTDVDTIADVKATFYKRHFIYCAGTHADPLDCNWSSDVSSLLNILCIVCSGKLASVVRLWNCFFGRWGTCA